MLSIKSFIRYFAFGFRACKVCMPNRVHFVFLAYGNCKHSSNWWIWDQIIPFYLMNGNTCLLNLPFEPRPRWKAATRKYVEKRSSLNTNSLAKQNNKQTNGQQKREKNFDVKEKNSTHTHRKKIQNNHHFNNRILHEFMICIAVNKKQERIWTLLTKIRKTQISKHQLSTCTTYIWIKSVRRPPKGCTHVLTISEQYNNIGCVTDLSIEIDWLKQTNLNAEMTKQQTKPKNRRKIVQHFVWHKHNRFYCYGRTLIEWVKYRNNLSVERREWIYRDFHFSRRSCFKHVQHKNDAFTWKKSNGNKTTFDYRKNKTQINCWKKTAWTIMPFILFAQ